MALGMKQWLGLTVGGCALVALWLLPPSPFTGNGKGMLGHEEIRYRNLQREVTRTQAVLQRIEWSDSLSALAVTTAKDGVAAAGDARLIRQAWVDTLSMLMHMEMAHLGTRADDAIVGYFVQPIDFAGQGIRAYAWQSRELYIGTRQGHPYCLRVIARSSPMAPMQPISRWRGPGGEMRSNVLGACRLVASYGLPGAKVTAWLKKGGIDYAEGDVGAQRERATVQDALMQTPQLFGRRRFFLVDRSLTAERCTAGSAEACLQKLLDPWRDLITTVPVDAALHGPVQGFIPSGEMPPLGNSGRYLVADLEAQFGPQRFRAFWTSNAEVPQAFEAAFGVPMDEWALSWVSDNLGLTRAGPSLPRPDALGGILLLALCAIVAGAWTRRRRVA